MALTHEDKVMKKALQDKSVERDTNDLDLSREYKENKVDNVNHPTHYNSHPSGVECITIIRHYCFTVGSAIKYLWRAGLKKEEGLEDKQKEIEDLEKAIFCIKDRIKQLKES